MNYEAVTPRICEISDRAVPYISRGRTVQHFTRLAQTSRIVWSH
jgi:hypothetical protein